MSSDVSELKEFQSKLTNLAKGEEGVSELCEYVTRQIGARFLSRVIPLTPVEENTSFQYKMAGRKLGTKVIRGGHLRRAWTANQDVPTGGEYAYLKSRPIKRLGKTYELEITNSAHYASYVEYGHKQRVGRFVPYIGAEIGGVKQGAKLTSPSVSGHHMMEKSYNQVNSMVPALTQKLVKEFFETHL